MVSQAAFWGHRAGGRVACKASARRARFMLLTAGGAPWLVCAVSVKKRLVFVSALGLDGPGTIFSNAATSPGSVCIRLGTTRRSDMESSADHCRGARSGDHREDVVGAWISSDSNPPGLYAGGERTVADRPSGIIPHHVPDGIATRCFLACRSRSTRVFLRC